MLKENTIFDKYNIRGRKIYSSQLDSCVVENRIIVSSLSEGVYVVIVKNSTQQKTQKVIIK
ncbi:T9SS type A sorting domain-containing protein [Psychroserpens jangbogonensis]|uniref:T9SS type A sorting domain-containing protein n=1 Tax=Psychroserpens jangbogonensis TaxID=1484460 RepID=UPI00053E410F